MRRLQLALIALAITLLAACASTPRTHPADGAHWQGRLAVKVYSKPMQAFAANFDLSGRPDKGELLLTSPLGSTLARMQWDVGMATLDANGEQKVYGSLQELARKATGTDVPVASLFAWLQGKNEAAAGWQADLSELSNGRLQARHAEEIEAELKIILDN
jgi:outer membrane lipoprotein LolB